MTTVAYRAGVMAADTLSTIGNYRVDGARKLLRVADGTLYGFCGNRALWQVWMDWVEAGARGEEPPVRDAHGDDGFCQVLRATPAGVVSWRTDHGWSCLDAAPYFAVGTDADIAMGAMHAGASAAAAVRAAIAHGVATGGSVRVISTVED